MDSYGRTMDNRMDKRTKLRACDVMDMKLINLFGANVPIYLKTFQYSTINASEY